MWQPFTCLDILLIVCVHTALSQMGQKLNSSAISIPYLPKQTIITHRDIFRSKKKDIFNGKILLILFHFFYNCVISSHKEHKSWIKLLTFWALLQLLMHELNYALSIVHVSLEHGSTVALWGLWPCRTYSLYPHPIKGLTN